MRLHAHPSLPRGIALLLFLIGLCIADFNSSELKLRLINGCDKTWCTFQFRLLLILDGHPDGTHQSKKQ